MNDQNRVMVDRIERCVQGDYDSDGTSSLSSSDSSQSDSNNGTSSQSNGGISSGELIPFNRRVVTDGRIEVHRPLNPVGVHQPPMENIVMAPNAICDCLAFGLGNCVIADRDYFRSRDIDFDHELQYARDTCHMIERCTNNVKRKELYRKVHRTLNFGPMERGDRRKLPNCVEAVVRRIYPETNGRYMGFKDAHAQPEELKDESM